MPELKKCPFCGGIPRVVETEPAPGEIRSRFIFCDNCTCTFEYAHVVPAPELIAGWNNRAKLEVAQNSTSNNSATAKKFCRCNQGEAWKKIASVNIRYCPFCRGKLRQ